MKRTIIGFVTCLLLGFTAQAQKIIDTWAFSTGVDSTLWMDISGHDSTIIAPGEKYSAGTGVLDIGFPFVLGNMTHNQFSTNINGTVRLGTAAMPGSGYYSQPLGNNINTGPKIEAYGWQACFDDSCYTRMALLGDSGSRVLVIETRLKDYMNDMVRLYVSFQVQLFEAGGLRIVYGKSNVGAVTQSTQNGVAATGSSSDKDVIFFDFATHTESRINGNCSLRNELGTWPEEGRWYCLTPDPNACPYPPAVTTTGCNPSSITLTSNYTGLADLHILIPDAGIDTLWPAEQIYLTLPTPLNPATTYNGTAQSVCGSNVSYRTLDFSFTTDCGEVVSLPWACNFNTTATCSCWDVSQYTSSTNRWKMNGQTMRCGYTNGQLYNEWLCTPVFNLPDTNGLTMKWDYRSDKSSNDSVAPVVDVRIAPCAADGTVDTSAWVTLLTLDELLSDFTPYYLNLDPWHGQRVKVAFVRTGMGGRYAAVDNVLLYQQNAPTVGIEATELTTVGDTASFSCHLLSGVDSNVQYTLHSSLLDTTATNSTGLFSLIYHTAGWDTVTVILSNAYGSDTATAIVDVLDCGIVSSFPWVDDFSHSTDCWEIWDWTKAPSAVGKDEEGVTRSYYNVMSSHALNCYMLTRPIAIPATGAENLSFWMECRPPLMVRVSPTASTDTADYTDTVLTLNFSSNNMWWYTFNLSAYAGDTVRVGLFHLSGEQTKLNQVKVDYNDTLPKLLRIDVPAKSFVDSTILCTATLRRGFTGQLTYTWHSSLMDTTWTLTTPVTQTSSSISLTYTLEGIDTISVIASNAYGSDTLWTTVRVRDCHPATTLPWHEDFQNGITCWYKPAGSNWKDVIPYNNPAQEHMRYLYLQMQNDQQGSWIISKEIQLPADTNFSPYLFWDVASNTRDYALHYGVLVTTSSNYTDTANYTEIYYDNVTHLNWSNYQRLGVNLAQYAGQAIHIAFHNHPNMAPSSDRCVCIDNVEIRSTAVPVLQAIQVAADIYTADSGNHAVAVMKEGTRYGLTYTWHSSLMDTTFITTSDTLPLHYTFGGTDTLTLVAANPYGADSLFAVVRVHHCPVALQAPLEEPFEWSSDLGCWRKWNFYTGTNSNGGWVLTNDPWTEPYNNIVFRANDNNSWLISPEIVLPASGNGLNLHLNVEGHTNQANVTYLAIRVSPTAGADTADFTDTLFYRYLSFHWEPLSLSLEAYAGQKVRFAFVHTVGGSYQQGLFIDSLRIGYDTLPVASVQHSEAFLGDTTLFSAVVNNCISTGLTYSWHSSMMGPLAGTTSTQVVYDRVGTDTLTFIVSNAYGSDTVVTLVTVGSHPLPEVTLSAPQALFVGDPIHYTFTLNDCSRNGLTLSLHSSLIDFTWLFAHVNSQFSLPDVVYSVGGYDTVTLIVSNLYGADTVSMVVYVIDCGAAAIPYYQDFEGVSATSYSTVGFLPDCWNYYWNGSNAAYAPHVITTGGYQYMNDIPDNALFFVAGSSTGYGSTSIVYLPRFADSLQHLAMTLDYRFESSSRGILTVGWFDGNDVFHTVKNLTPHDGGYVRDTVLFTDQEAANYRIALWWEFGSTWYAAAVDNIEVYVDNTIYPPAGLVVDSVSATCATFSWQPVDSAAGYFVTLGDSLAFTTDTTITLCGLNDDSDYGVQVAVLIGADTGRFSLPVSFRTALLCAPIASVSVSPMGELSWQYAASGEVAPSGALIEISDLSNGTFRTDTAYAATYTPSSLAPGHRYSFAVRTLCDSLSAHQVLSATWQMPPAPCAEAASGGVPSNPRFMDNFWSHNYSQIIYPASFAANVDTLYGIALRVADADAWTSSTYQYGFDIYVGQTPVMPTSPLSADSLVAVGIDKRFTVVDGAYWVDFLFDSAFVYDGTSNLVVTLVDRVLYPYSDDVVFGVHSDPAARHFAQPAGSFTTYPNPFTLNFSAVISTDIPDIRLLGGCSAPICMAPTVQVASLDGHSVSLAWQPQGIEDHWQIEHRLDGSTQWTVDGTTTATTFTILGLSPSARYQLRVASICSGDTLYCYPLAVTTPCGSINTPYAISFMPEEIPCWTLPQGVYSYRNTALYLYGSYILSPAIAENISTLQATITVDGSYNSTGGFAVGVCDSAASNIVWVDTIPAYPASNHSEVVFFNRYPSYSGNHIIIKEISTIARLISFSLETIQGCTPVFDLAADQVTTTGARVSWTSTDDNHTYAVYLDGNFFREVTVNQCLFPGLTPSTLYQVAVRRICGPGDTADATIGYFRTDCNATTNLPYFEDFEYSVRYGDSVEMPSCWTFHNPTGHASVWLTGFDSETSIPVMSLYGGFGSQASYVCTPLLTVGPNGAKVRFKGQTSQDEIFIAGIMIDPSDTATFIPIDTVSINPRTMRWYEFSTDSIPACAAAGAYAVAFRFWEDNDGLVDSLIVTALPAPDTVWHTVTVTSADTTMGTVTGGGLFADGSDIILTAIPFNGEDKAAHIEFDRWNDGNTDNPRQIKVTSDTAFTAFFRWVEDSVGIVEVRNEKCEVVIYPNPSHGDITVSVSEPSTLTVIDLTGRVVIPSVAINTSYLIPHTSLTPGAYFVRVTTRGNTIVKKLIIK